MGRLQDCQGHKTRLSFLAKKKAMADQNMDFPNEYAPKGNKN